MVPTIAELAGVGRGEIEPGGKQLVWTLPSGHPFNAWLGGSYLNVAVSLSEEARESLVLVSPHVEARGIGYLFDRLSGALARGVATMMVAQDLSDIVSTNSRAVEDLRREAERVGGLLEVFSATSATGRDREHHPLLRAHR